MESEDGGSEENGQQEEELKQQLVECKAQLDDTHKQKKHREQQVRM